MDGVLELQRRTHEVVDHLEEAVVQSLIQQPRTHRGRLTQEHYVSSLLDQIVQGSVRLEALYADTAARQADLDRITAAEDSPLVSFYDQLKAVKDRHRRLGAGIDDIVEYESLKSAGRLSDEALARMFSGEESLGRFLDLLEQYELYINLKDNKKVVYLRYLDQVDNFALIPLSIKSSSQYETYLLSLQSYLEGFLARTKPLLDHRALVGRELEAFEAQWSGAKVSGWEDLARNESDELFCDACQKQFYNPSVYANHLPGKKHQKAAAECKEKKGGLVVEGKRWAKDIARTEAAIAALFRLLSKEREDTKNHVEAKQSRSSAERALDLEREEEAAEEEGVKNSIEESSDEDAARDPKIYNPKDLPLDWDGKPIPYWLWKLHGLGTRYPCEICGNQDYMGRKAFDQHFFEWRHTHGLKCLGIPATRHFFQVTSISDAVALWEKLKKEARQANFRPEQMEELEDQHGNVYNRKTYEDLKRQGLL